MKKLLIALALLLLPAIGAAVTLNGGCAGVLPGNDMTFSYNQWTSGFTCTQGDKMYSNFVPGEAPTSTTLRLQEYTLAGNDFHSVMFGGIFSSPFTISYDVQIVSGPEFFKRVSADLIGTAQEANPQLVKTVYDLGGAHLLGGMSAFVNNSIGVCGNDPHSAPYPCQPLYLSGNYTGLHIVDTFTPNGGVANSIGNAYLQGVPEPSTMALFGAGLVALSFLRRRK